MHSECRMHLQCRKRSICLERAGAFSGGNLNMLRHPLFSKYTLSMLRTLEHAVTVYFEFSKLMSEYTINLSMLEDSPYIRVYEENTEVCSEDTRSRQEYTQSAC